MKTLLTNMRCIVDSSTMWTQYMHLCSVYNALCFIWVSELKTTCTTLCVVQMRLQRAYLQYLFQVSNHQSANSPIYGRKKLKKTWQWHQGAPHIVYFKCVDKESEERWSHHRTFQIYCSQHFRHHPHQLVIPGGEKNSSKQGAYVVSFKPLLLSSGMWGEKSESLCRDIKLIDLQYQGNLDSNNKWDDEH